MALRQLLKRPIGLLVFMLAFLLVFSSCIFGRKGRNCNCPTWGYEIKSTQEAPASNANGV